MIAERTVSEPVLTRFGIDDEEAERYIALFHNPELALVFHRPNAPNSLPSLEVLEEFVTEQRRYWKKYGKTFDSLRVREDFDRSSRYHPTAYMGWESEKLLNPEGREVEVFYYLKDTEEVRLRKKELNNAEREGAEFQVKVRDIPTVLRVARFFRPEKPNYQDLEWYKNRRVDHIEDLTSALEELKKLGFLEEGDDQDIVKFQRRLKGLLQVTVGRNWSQNRFSNVEFRQAMEEVFDEVDT